MFLIVFTTFLVCVLGAPQDYNAPSSTGLSEGNFGRQFGGVSSQSSFPGQGGNSGRYGTNCPPGQVPHLDGSCIRPEVTRNVFVYASPEMPEVYVPPPQIPRPKINYNVVFVRTPERQEGLEPIVVPPPQERTVVYVLTKNGEIGQRVIEVPARPGQKPEVFYVSYNDGDNPILPGGISLQEALESGVSQKGQFIGGNSVLGGGDDYSDEDFSRSNNFGTNFGGGGGTSIFRGIPSSSLGLTETSYEAPQSSPFIGRQRNSLSSRGGFGGSDTDYDLSSRIEGFEGGSTGLYGRDDNDGIGDGYDTRNSNRIQGIGDGYDTRNRNRIQGIGDGYDTRNRNRIQGIGGNRGFGGGSSIDSYGDGLEGRPSIEFNDYDTTNSNQGYSASQAVY